MILRAEVDILDVMEENAYFYIDDTTRHGFLIDPGAQPEELLSIAEQNEFTVEKILLTHGHYDHIGAVNEIRRVLKVPVFMGRGGAFYAYDAINNGSKFFGDGIITRSTARFITVRLTQWPLSATRFFSADTDARIWRAAPNAT